MATIDNTEVLGYYFDGGQYGMVFVPAGRRVRYMFGREKDESPPSEALGA